ncbi:MAG: hypothetical protein PHN94_01785 [Bacteroidales bacterium]|nr:hypothetical protein [Bacteroidales bacterium]
MKNFTLLFTAIILGLATMAQAPMGINYQTVIRDGDGNILPDTELSLQMTIRSGAPDGEVVYTETHDATTNAFGLVNLVIGYGYPQNNAFSDINWGDGDKYLETAIDLTGGGTYTVLGVSQFLSVPYAMHSQTTETFAETDPEFNAWDKSTGITITENQISDLQDYLTEETDPEFDAWDKSSGIAITENQITDLQDYLTEELDGDPANEIQTLSQDGLDVTLSQGGGTISVADDDNDPANELQELTQYNYQVSMTQGGGSIMTGVKSFSQAEIDAMTPYNGLTVHNSTTNCINYYYPNNWFEACGTCTPQPTQAAAGDDQAFYDETLTATLAANTPEQGTGLWTVESGEGGSFDDATLPEAIFTGQPCTAYILAWTISNTCGTSTDLVNVSFFETPSVADAGSDTIVGGGATSVNLYANVPEMGEGLWMIISGEGGTLGEASNPSSLFSGITGETYLLEWTISATCGTSSDPESDFCKYPDWRTLPGWHHSLHPATRRPRLH